MEAFSRRDIPGEVVLTITNRKHAGVLQVATSFGVAARVLSPEEVGDGTSILEVLEDVGADAVALAGYLRHVPEEVVRRFRNRIVNVHPALLPAFGGKGMYGLHVHRAVIESGARWSGATVHFVDEQYDTGPIILQSPVPVLQDDSAETLAARVLDVEHHLYPIALRLLAHDRLHVDGRRVLIEEDSPEPLSDPRST